MPEKIRIIPPNPNGTNSTDRETLGQILLKMGFTVRFVKDKDKSGKRTTTVIEYWEEDSENDGKGPV